MDKRERWVQGVLAVLLVVGLVWSYLLTHPSTAGKGRGPSAVNLWTVPLEEVTGLEFREGTFSVTLGASPGEEKDKPDVWVEVSGGPPKAQSQRAGKAPTPEADAPAAFKGNATAQGSLRSFANALAVRDLGPLSGMDAEALGLKEQKDWLEVKRGQDDPPLKLVLGRITYGGANRYVLASTDERVYLMRNAEFSRLVQARGTMMDRQLLDMGLKAVRRMEVVLGAARQVYRKDPEAELWRDAGDGEQDGKVNALLRALFGLQAKEYLSPEEGERRRAALGPDTLTLKLWDSLQDGRERQISLGAVGKKDAWAESSHTGKPVAVEPAKAAGLMKAAQALFAGT